MPSTISTKLASMILLHKGEISRSDIAALPGVEDDSQVDLIISILIKSMHATIQQRRNESSLLPDWEDTIILMSTLGAN